MKNASTTSELQHLYIADANNRIERQWLRQWLVANKQLNESIRVFFFALGQEKRQLDLHSLVACLEQANDALDIVPLRLLWPPNEAETQGSTLKRMLLGDDSRPGYFRSRQLLRNKANQPECLQGESASLGALKQRFGKDDPESLAAFITRQAGLALDIAERKRPNGRFKLPRYVADSIHNSEPFNQALIELSEESGKPVDALRQESKTYLKELVSVPKRLALDLRVWLDDYMISQGYEEGVVYNKADIEKLRDVVKEHPTMVLWTHKIYYDGSVVTSVLHKHRLLLLHMFGGINMAFLGLGWILRHSGTIFIRRSFQDNPLYKIVLRQYIAYLMEKRFPLSWSFEGTRSRIGKLMPPRYGLLKYVLESAYDAGIGNIHISPMSVSYDFMRDVEDFTAEQTGKEKKPESLKWFLSYVSSLRRPMGRIYLDVAEPVVIETVPEPGDSLALSKIAFEVAVRVNEVTPITLTSLVCFCLLGAAPRALTRQELQAQVTQLAQWALARNIRISSDFDLQNKAHTLEISNILVKNGLLTYYDQGVDMVIGIAQDQHPVASYYRNMIVHHYLNKAIIELALLKVSDAGNTGDEALQQFWQETELLRDLFKFEFFYPAKNEFKQLLEAELRRVNEDWPTLLGQTGGAMVLLQAMMPIVAHAVFLPFVEAYIVLAECVARLPAEQAAKESSCVAQSLKQAKQAYLQRRITSEASIAKLLFSNAFKLMNNMGLTDSGDEQLTERRIELVNIFRAQARNIDRLRLMALPRY